ncbi:MAG: hypothetical protein PVG03_13465, partial [Desulfarculaceae bacterium]
MVRPWLEKSLAPPQGAASIGAMELGLFPPAAAIKNLVIDHPSRYRLEIKQLTAEFDLAKLFQDEPWIKHVDIDRLRFSAAPVAGDTDEPLDLEALGWIFAAQQGRVRNSSLAIKTPKYRLSLKNLNLDLKSQPDKAAGLFVSSGLEFAVPGGPAQLRGNLKIRGLVEPRPLLKGELILEQAQLKSPFIQGVPEIRAEFSLDRDKAVLEKATVQAPAANLTLPKTISKIQTPVNMKLSGEIMLGTGTGTCSIQDVTLGRLFKGAGEVKLNQGRDLALSFQGEAGQIQKMLYWFAPHLPAQAQSLSISGNLPLRGQAQKTRDRPWKLSLTCQPENLVLQGAGLKAQAWGRINLSGSLPDAFALSGEIKAKGSFGSGTLNVKEFSLLAPLAGTLNSPSSPAWILKAPPHSLSYGKLTLPLGEVKARGKLVSQPGGFTLEGLVLGLGGLGTLHGGARQHQGAIKGELEGKDLPAEKVKNLAEVFSPGLQGWKCGGPLDLKINLQGRPENPDTLTIRLGLALKGLNFTSPQED